MENKLNKEAIDSYIKRFSVISLDELYADKETISGDDILKLPIKQTGLFSLRIIFDSWKEESSKLKSVYFNYSDPLVEKALTRLMNVLSNHISIGRSDFEPVYEAAVAQTIYLLFSPYHYYESLLEELSGAKNLLTELKNAQKFIKSNAEVLVSVIERLTVQPGIEVDALLNEVFSNISGSPDDIQKSLDQFSEILTLTTDLLYSSDSEQKIAVDNLLANSYFVAGEIETVHEQFNVEEKVTLADTLASANNDSIKTMLTINQKFMFINDLFDGNQDDFIKIIDFLDECATEDVAMGFIQNNYIKKSLWSSESPSVKELLKLVHSKFN